MIRIVIAILIAVAWLDGHAQSSESPVKARLVSSPSLDDFFPASMERRRVAGAAARARICVDADGRPQGDAEVYAPSFYPAFDKAVIKMAKQAKYAAGEIDGKPVPSCVALAYYGTYSRKLTAVNRKAVEGYVAQLNTSLPEIYGDLEVKDARFVDGKIIFTKVFWKKTRADFSDVNLEEMYRANRSEEARLHCKVKAFEDMFRIGVSVVSWFQTSDGKILYGIVSNEESCS